MIFDDVLAKEPIINACFCRARHENCDMIYLKQNMFSADRQNVRENCNLFIFFEQRGKGVTAICYDLYTGSQLSYTDFSNIWEKVWSRPYIYTVIDKSLNKYNCVKLRTNWDWRVL